MNTSGLATFAALFSAGLILYKFFGRPSKEFKRPMLALGVFLLTVLTIYPLITLIIK